MCKKNECEKIELSEKELSSLIKTEYEQICQDWRHRDSMLWQSLAVAIALTGLTFSIVFNKEMKLDWSGKGVVLFLAFFLNMVLLVKIWKDHYYQIGSDELLSKIGGQQLIETYNLCEDNKYDLRIHKPSGKFFLAKVSTFKCFFIVQLILSTITFGYASYCFVRLYYF